MLVYQWITSMKDLQILTFKWLSSVTCTLNGLSLSVQKRWKKMKTLHHDYMWWEIYSVKKKKIVYMYNRYCIRSIWYLCKTAGNLPLFCGFVFARIYIEMYFQACTHRFSSWTFNPFKTMEFFHWNEWEKKLIEHARFMFNLLQTIQKWMKRVENDESCVCIKVFSLKSISKNNWNRNITWKKKKKLNLFFQLFLTLTITLCLLCWWIWFLFHFFSSFFGFSVVDWWNDFPLNIIAIKRLSACDFFPKKNSCTWTTLVSSTENSIYHFKML